jgi:hypothetical protein
LGQIDAGEVPTVVPSLLESPFVRDFPPDLIKIVNAWPSLPMVVKAGVLAMVEAVAEGQTSMCSMRANQK